MSGERLRLVGRRVRERLPVLRYYSVFNLDQTEGVDPSKVPAADAVAVAPVPTAEEIVAGFQEPPTIEHRAQPRAFYRPATDSVTMPPRSAFGRIEGYYSTLFHELTHATGCHGCQPIGGQVVSTRPFSVGWHYFAVPLDGAARGVVPLALVRAPARAPEALDECTCGRYRRTVTRGIRNFEY